MTAESQIVSTAASGAGVALQMADENRDAARREVNAIFAEIEQLKTQRESEQAAVDAATKKQSELLTEYGKAMQKTQINGKGGYYNERSGPQFAGPFNDTTTNMLRAQQNVTRISGLIVDANKRRAAAERGLRLAEIECEILATGFDLDTLQAKRDQAQQEWEDSVCEAERKVQALNAVDAQCLDRHANLVRLHAIRKATVSYMARALAALAVMILVCVLLAMSAAAQQLPDAPKPHFLNRETVSELAASAVFLSTDALATQKAEAYRTFGVSKELNPIARVFVGSRTGTAIYFGAGFAAETGLSYLAYKKNWTWPGRIFRFTVIVSEAYYAHQSYHSAHLFSHENNCIHNHIIHGTQPPPGPCLM